MYCSFIFAHCWISLRFTRALISSSLLSIKLLTSENSPFNLSHSSFKPYISKEISSYSIRLISSFKIASFSSKLILSESNLSQRLPSFLIKFAILFSKLYFSFVEALSFSAISKTADVSSLNNNIVFFYFNKILYLTLH